MSIDAATTITNVYYDLSVHGLLLSSLSPIEKSQRRDNKTVITANDDLNVISTYVCTYERRGRAADRKTRSNGSINPLYARAKRVNELRIPALVILSDLNDRVPSPWSHNRDNYYERGWASVRPSSSSSFCLSFFLFLSLLIDGTCILHLTQPPSPVMHAFPPSRCDSRLA